MVSQKHTSKVSPPQSECNGNSDSSLLKAASPLGPPATVDLDPRFCTVEFGTVSLLVDAMCKFSATVTTAGRKG